MARRVQLVFTPRHGIWLHRAELELSVLTRQALSPRMPTQAAVPAQVTAWAEACNAAQKGINWQFRTTDARVRLNIYTTQYKHDGALGAVLSRCFVPSAPKDKYKLASDCRP